MKYLRIVIRLLYVIDLNESQLHAFKWNNLFVLINRPCSVPWWRLLPVAFALQLCWPNRSTRDVILKKNFAYVDLNWTVLTQLKSSVDLLGCWSSNKGENVKWFDIIACFSIQLDTRKWYTNVGVATQQWRVIWWNIQEEKPFTSAWYEKRSSNKFYFQRYWETRKL